MVAPNFAQPLSVQMIEKNQDQQRVEEFNAARFKARWNQLVSRLTFQVRQLKDLNRVAKGYQHSGHAEVGVRTVPLANIVGSLGRSGDFDRTFMPQNDRTRTRWINIDRAVHQDIPLPPVELYQVGDEYYVVDGHHRLSVSRAHGQQFVEARVTKFDAPH